MRQSGKSRGDWRELEKKILWEFDKQIQIKFLPADLLLYCNLVELTSQKLLRLQVVSSGVK